MNQRNLLALAAALTAFVLVFGGGLVARLTQSTTTTATPATAQGALDPAVEALIREREAAYQQALDEANRQLAEANRLLAQQQTAPVTQADAPAEYAVSVEQAQLIALNANQNAALIKPAELVSFAGTPAYEVTLDQGMVYVDAWSATILGSTIQQTISGEVSVEQAAQIAVSYRGGGTIRDVEQEREHDMLVYEVKFSDGAEVYVDATNGNVVYARLDMAAAEHEDDHDDEYDD